MPNDIAPLGLRRPSRRRWLLVAGFSVAAVTLTTGLAFVGWWWSGAERTELAQWAMAAAAMLTLIAAVSAAVFAAGAFSLESDREDRWHDTQRRAQASLVAAWAVGRVHIARQGDTLNEKTGVLEGGTIGLVFDTVLRNASEVPVTEVVVTPGVETFYVRPGGDDVRVDWFMGGDWRLAVLPPDVEPMHIKLKLRDDGVPADDLRKIYGDEAKFRREPFVNLEFSDAAGLRWRRTPSHYLRELPPRRVSPS